MPNNSKLIRISGLLTILLASAAVANNGRYDRGYANDGLSQSCVVMLAYHHMIGRAGSAAILPCLHPD